MTSAAPPAPLVTIDALGRKCPVPIIMLAERIREVPIGQVIAVLADDPAARTDVPSWCAMKSHDCVAATDLPQGWAPLIRRRYVATRCRARWKRPVKASHSPTTAGCPMWRPGACPASPAPAVPLPSGPASARRRPCRLLIVLLII
jgi:tRNA 2-thiouridine synthesizing protein A